MNIYRSGKEPGKTPKFVQPFLKALNQIHRSDAGSLEQIKERATKCQLELLGENKSTIATAWSRSSIGLQADHTHYFDGFALMLPMKGGLAVAISIGNTSESRMLVEGEDSARSFSIVETSRSTASDSDIIQLLRHVVLTFPHSDLSTLDFSLSSEIPGALLPVFAASFAVALHKALEELTGISFNDTDRVLACQNAIEEFFGTRFSPAYIRAANISDKHTFVLIDTRSLDYVPLDISDRDKPGWGLIDSMPESRPILPPDRFALTESITDRLKSKQFKDITTIRDLEHRDFDAAEKSLPRKMRSGFRFLVTENRRVQQLVTAIRRNDWQLCGTILSISHQARRECWNATSPRQDEVVDLAERFSHSGVYGATQTGETAFVLVTGQPFSIPGFLDAVRSHTYLTPEKNPQTTIL